MCVCFVTAVNLGTLELTLLYNPMTAALTCSIHRAKVGESHKKYIHIITCKFRLHNYLCNFYLCLMFRV
jgi:hypothetical protein